MFTTDVDFSKSLGITLIYSFAGVPLRLACALGVRMSDDVKGVIEWSNVFAMSFLSIVPCIVTFFLAQKYFVEGISTTGIKG